MGIEIIKDPHVGFKIKIRKDAPNTMPMNMSTWEKAASRYKEMGMSPKEMKKYKMAWEKKHKKMPTPKMLGKGMAAGAAKVAVSRKSKLEQLAAELDGKEF